MDKRNFFVGSYEEALEVDRRGQFLLIGYCKNGRVKKLTEDEAKEWYQEKFPKSSWEKARKEIDGFLKEVV